MKTILTNLAKLKNLEMYIIVVIVVVFIIVVIVHGFKINTKVPAMHFKIVLHIISKYLMKRILKVF